MKVTLREREREREIRRLVLFFLYSISLFDKILNPTSCVTEESLKNHIVFTKHLNTLINLILNLKKTIKIIMNNPNSLHYVSGNWPAIPVVPLQFS